MLSSDSDTDARGTTPIGECEGCAFYDEEAFRHFLGVEQKRAARSRRNVLLLLVDISSAHADIPGAVIARAVPALAHCVREMDFIGWYSTGAVLGAVLVQPSHERPLQVAAGIRTRVSVTLRKRVGGELTERLRIRLVDAGTLSDV